MEAEGVLSWRTWRLGGCRATAWQHGGLADGGTIMDAEETSRD